jgi:hypothetical protein
MLLDASGDAHLYSQIFSDMKIHNLEARRNANIYQVQRKSFSRQSILGVDAFGREIRPDEAEKLRQGIIQVIVGRLEVHEKILVVAQLAVTKFLEGPLQPYIDSGRIQLAHFNALRGLNSFESCTSAVIIGRVQPSPGAVEALARALYWDDPKPLVLGLNQYTRKTSTRRMADGSTQTEWIDQHPDPRANAILQQFRERELEQAVDRLRLIYDIDPKDVLLLTNIPIEAEITAAAPWRQLHNAGRNRIGRAILQSIEKIGTITIGAQDYEAAVLPFSRESGRCFTKIWPSLQSAKDSWDDGGGLNGGRSQIRIIFGNTPHFIVTYRRPKQPGRSCHALVAIRPTAAPHVPKNGTDDPNPADSECASTAPNSDPYQNSQDDLQAAAKIALQRLIPEAKIISIEPSVDNKSGR